MSILNDLKKIEVEGDFHQDGYMILRSLIDANEIANLYDSIREKLNIMRRTVHYLLVRKSIVQQTIKKKLCFKNII